MDPLHPTPYTLHPPLLTATLTPFDSSGVVDLGVVRAHAKWLVEEGVGGLCPAGTTGEFLYLSEEEKRSVTAATVEAAAGRVPVIAGVWALRTADIADNARAAADAGANGVFLPPPIYYPADDDVIRRYYEAVRQASPLPAYAYNIPRYAANEISFACLERLVMDGTIAGVKDSTGKAERVGELVRWFRGRVAVFAASDSFASEGRRLGADGFISAIANVYPALMVRAWNGDETAQGEIDHVRMALKRVGSISGLKALLTRRGFDFGTSRLPFSELGTDALEALGALS